MCPGGSGKRKGSGIRRNSPIKSKHQRMQNLVAKRYGNKGSTSSTKSKSRKSTGSKKSSSKTRTSASRTRKTSLSKRLRRIVRRAANRVFNRSKSNKTTSTTKIPSTRQAKAGARKARKQQAGTVKTRSPSRRVTTRNSFVSQFSR